jgi:Zn-dependent protease with chaperone function
MSEQVLNGRFNEAGCSRIHQALACMTDDRSVQILHAVSRAPLMLATSGQYRPGDDLPGLAQPLHFPDGALFTPDDTGFRWPGGHDGWVSMIERRWSLIVLAVLLIPLFMWLTLTVWIPALARASVPMIPDVVAQTLGQHTLATLDEVWMQPTELAAEQQAQIRASWQKTLQRLGYPEQRFPLLFRASSIGANAMALTDGSILITDHLVWLLDSDQDALLAVLLHELAHQEFQHGMQQAVQAVASSVLYSLLLSDMEGISESLLGAGVSLAGNAFSREMEREADARALWWLQHLGLSPQAFARAIKALYLADGSLPEEEYPAFEFFSTHPGMQERIQAADSMGPQPD